MDAAEEEQGISILSYDDQIPYEEQVPVQPADGSGSDALLKRISNTKVYLLPDAASARVGKRKHTESENDNDVEMDEEDLFYRPNALLLNGSPISHLPTASIFAYCTNFSVQPMGLEWLNDNTCIIIFESKADARKAHQQLAKPSAEEADEDGFIIAKSVPVALWPAEDRINKSLGIGEGLKGSIKMRWARADDVKKRGAKRESEFYRKYGITAGKDAERGEAPLKKQRPDAVNVQLQKADLDDDLDAFLAEDREPSPPSKMRSDYMDSNGRTLLERTSSRRPRTLDLASRITAPLPRRPRRPAPDRSNTPNYRGRTDENHGRGRRGGERTKKSQQELDDELDAFLNEN